MLEQDYEKLNALYDQLEELDRGRFRKGTRKSDYEISREIAEIQKQVNEIEKRNLACKMTKDLSILLRETRELIQDINNSLYDPSVIETTLHDMHLDENYDMDD